MPYIRGQHRRSEVLAEMTIDDHGNIHPAYLWWCPGCEAWGKLQPEGSYGHGVGTHIFHIPPWTFDNDNMEKPSFSASYLSYGIPANPDADPKHFPSGYAGSPRCHSFVKDGMIQFLADCDHPLAGQTVPMAPIPDWLHG